MITNTISSDLTTEYVIDHSSQKWVLNEGVTITSATNGISEAGNLKDNIIAINGSITANAYNRAAVWSDGDNAQINIGQSGSLNGYFGVRVSGENANVVNNGEIHTALDGIYGVLTSAALVNKGIIDAEGSGIKVAEGEFNITNSGDISGYYGIRVEHADVVVNLDKGGTVDGSVQALRVISQAGDTATFINNGSVSVSEGGYALWGEAGAETLTNNGTVLGDISMGDGRDRIVNRGAMSEGKIDLGAGGDVFDGRGGTFSGNIFGGAGNDVFIVDKANVKLNEFAEGGRDTVKSTVSFTLSDGVAIEDLRLLGKAALNAEGNGLDNHLYGNAGSNKLIGGAGDDLLLGGKGKDVLSGNAGADTFVFKTGFGSDTIKDFLSGEDHIDLSGAGKIASFTDLVSHHLTAEGSDLVIHNGADTLVLHDVQKSDLNVSDFIF